MPRLDLPYCSIQVRPGRRQPAPANLDRFTGAISRVGFEPVTLLYSGKATLTSAIRRRWAARQRLSKAVRLPTEAG